jgi:hypothetical protein
MPKPVLKPSVKFLLVVSVHDINAYVSSAAMSIVTSVLARETSGIGLASREVYMWRMMERAIVLMFLD